ncbi:MAG: class I SAM-dependent methyltransferase [Patescibacteria group bacterium]|nr:class I SAM-dependent methyltransferase [Patescibacteria group bacterium]
MATSHVSETDRLLSEVLEKASIKNVLDLGAGDGRYSVCCADLGAKVDAVDLNPFPEDIIDHLNIRTIMADLNKFRLPARLYNLVIMRSILHYLKPKEAESLLRRVRRHVAPGGFIYIFTTTPAGSNRYAYTPEIITKMLKPLILCRQEETSRADRTKPDGLFHSWSLLYQNVRSGSACTV